MHLFYVVSRKRERHTATTNDFASEIKKNLSRKVLSPCWDGTAWVRLMQAPKSRQQLLAFDLSAVTANAERYLTSVIHVEEIESLFVALSLKLKIRSLDFIVLSWVFSV